MFWLTFVCFLENFWLTFVLVFVETRQHLAAALGRVPGFLYDQLDQQLLSVKVEIRYKSSGFPLELSLSEKRFYNDTTSNGLSKKWGSKNSLKKGYPLSPTLGCPINIVCSAKPNN